VEGEVGTAVEGGVGALDGVVQAVLTPTSQLSTGQFQRLVLTKHLLVLIALPVAMVASQGPHSLIVLATRPLQNYPPRFGCRLAGLRLDLGPLGRFCDLDGLQGSLKLSTLPSTAVAVHLNNTTNGGKDQD
jgi:hypothetical protein